MARSRRHPRHLTPRRPHRRGRLSTLLIVALIVFGAFYLANDQGWIHVGRRGTLPIPHLTVPPITLGKPPPTTAQADRLGLPVHRPADPNARPAKG